MESRVENADIIQIVDVLRKENKTISEDITEIEKALKQIGKLLSETDEDSSSEESQAAIKEDVSVSETSEEQHQAIEPKFWKPVDINGIRYRYSDSIVLKVHSDHLGSKTTGVLLNKGFYKIKYVTSTVDRESSGLAFFDLNKKFRKLISWQTVAGYKYLINQNGSTYEFLEDPAILAITDDSAKFMPTEFFGAITVSITELKIPPH